MQPPPASPRASSPRSGTDASVHRPDLAVERDRPARRPAPPHSVRAGDRAAETHAGGQVARPGPGRRRAHGRAQERRRPPPRSSTDREPVASPHRRLEPQLALRRRPAAQPEGEGRARRAPPASRRLGADQPIHGAVGRPGEPQHQPRPTGTCRRRPARLSGRSTAPIGRGARRPRPSQRRRSSRRRARRRGAELPVRPRCRRRGRWRRARSRRTPTGARPPPRHRPAAPGAAARARTPPARSRRPSPRR